MQQSKLGSFIEAAANTVIGLTIAFISQLIIFPMVGVYVPLSTNFEICAWFTLISIIRGYLLRRYFNKRLHKAAMTIAQHYV